MSPVKPERSLLLVHAHPDDESIFTGATMARYAAERAHVTLVTCTMGELGINRLAPGPAGKNGMTRAPDLRDRIQDIRARELAAACAALGVTDHRFLGGPGRWRDSGPLGHPAGEDPGCFRRADVEQAADQLAEVIREVGPQVIVTYHTDGFSMHPDHVQAHKVAWRAYQLACDHRRAKFYAVTMPRSVLAAAIRNTPWSAGQPSLPSAETLRVGLPDDQVTTRIDAAAYLEAKLAALKAHATQITIDGPFFWAAGLTGVRALGTEYYVQLAGPNGPDGTSPAADGEDDLFRGL